MPILRTKDKESLAERLQLARPAFREQADGAFELFADLARQAFPSYSSVGNFDSQAMMFQNVAAYALTWSNTVMRMELDYQGLPGTAERNDFAHINHLPFREVPGKQAGLGEWLVAIPAKSNQRDNAKAFIKWVTYDEIE